jgi:hypothetical protein
MSTISAEGFAQGFEERAYGPIIRGSIPVLNSFYFGYGVGGPPVDNHLNSVMVLPGGPSRDLTPGADLNPADVDAGRMQVMLRDEDPRDVEDEYFYRVSHALLQRSATRFQMRDVGCVGTCNRKIPLPTSPIGGAAHGPSVLALCGFKLFFTGSRDHEIDQLQVMLDDQNGLTVGFNDKRDNDVFAYVVDFARITGPGINIAKGQSSGTARGGDRVTVPRPSQTDLVLRGFSFDFKSGDHHLRDIGVNRVGNRLEVFFGDVNGDDVFDWVVRWAHVGPQVFAPA